MTAVHLISLGRKLSNVYAGLCLPICRKYGINQTCFDILLFCANNPAYNTARDIGQMRGIKSGMASVAIEMLIENGYLLRTSDERDRRKQRLVLTEKAASAVSEGQAMQAFFTATLTEGVTDEEIAAFFRLTEKLEKNLTQFRQKEAPSC